jgi:FAD/FMN-containing dehydrogenase
MVLFNQISYNPTTTFVDVGAGQIWDNVSKTLVNNYNVNVNGATTCPNVGVSGFNLGGGYGNKSNQFGLAIDNIQSIDAVLPGGDIVTASPQSYPDLFVALKVRSRLWCYYSLISRLLREEEITSAS